MTHPFRVTPPPPNLTLGGRRQEPPPLTFLNGERIVIDASGCATAPPGVRLVERLPEDIESIEVLARDEAVKRYGAEGAAGAVLITTRSERVP